MDYPTNLRVGKTFVNPDNVEMRITEIAISHVNHSDPTIWITYDYSASSEVALISTRGYSSGTEEVTIENFLHNLGFASE